MSNLLRRDLSPVADEAWKMLDDFASAILRQRLSGRKVVDFSGPHGLEFSAVNVGTLRPSEKAADGVGWGIRQVLPLIETRVPFSLGQWELDDISRGRRDPDLKPLEEAVMKAAEFEDAAVFHGFEGGRIEGLLAATPHKPVAMPGKIDGLPAAIGEAIKKITQAGIGGPFAVVLGVNPYVELASTMPCCVPLLKTVGDLAGGPVVPSGVLKGGGVVISTRGGDFELTVGCDFALGYQHHDHKNVDFFITESFTFQVIEPRAAVELKVAK